MCCDSIYPPNSGDDVADEDHLAHKRERRQKDQCAEKLSLYRSGVLSHVGKINMDNTWM